MRIIQLVKNFIFGDRKDLIPGAYPAIADALQSILGKKQWQSILRNIPDRRQLLEEAALKK